MTKMAQDAANWKVGVLQGKLKESNTKLAHALSVVLAQDRELEGMKKNLEQVKQKFDDTSFDDVEHSAAVVIKEARLKGFMEGWMAVVLNQVSTQSVTGVMLRLGFCPFLGFHLVGVRGQTVARLLSLVNLHSPSSFLKPNSYLFNRIKTCWHIKDHGHSFFSKFTFRKMLRVCLGSTHNFLLKVLQIKVKVS